MGRNGVKVVIRTRPTASFAQSQIQIDQDENTILVQTGNNNNSHNHSSEDGGGPSNRKDSWKFRFHQVLHNAGQDTVYEAIARDIVYSSVVQGINGTILAYGQTGAGKTFTMIGDTRNYQYRGIAPRAVAQVFNEVNDRIETSFDIHITYMEIYNDRIFDLLDDGGGGNKEYVIVEDAKGTSVRGLRHVQVSSEKEALDALFNGELQRTVAKHSLNKNSNRSHCIFTVHISQKSRAGGSERVLHSKLHLVDLAGSERLKKTMEENDSSLSLDKGLKKESMYINQSLTFLEQCIVALGAKATSSSRRTHIPYRQTKLTNVLKDSLGGNSNTLMFACVWGESKHLEETISTLKLAQRMMRVRNETSSIVETDPVLLLKKYEKQIKDLKQELNMHDALVERTGVSYDEFTPEQIYDLTRMVRNYVDAEDGDDEGILELKTVQQIRQLFRQFKLLVRNAESGNSSRITSRAGTAPRSGTNGTDHEERGLDDKPQGNDSDHRLVGENESQRGFGLGLASDAARPASVDAAAAVTNISGDSKDSIPFSSFESKAESYKPSGGAKDEERSNDDYSKSDAFAYYKTTAKENATLLKQKQDLKNIKETYKRITVAVNSSKERIDTIGFELDEKRKTNSAQLNKQERQVAGIEQDDVVDEEEFLLMKEEREAKKEYRSAYDELKSLRIELDNATRAVDKTKNLLLEDFEVWYKKGGRNNIVDDGDKLDDGEKFDQMEIDRVYADDPESLAFFQAQKKMRQNALSTSPTHRRTR